MSDGHCRFSIAPVTGMHTMDDHDEHFAPITG
jgi:hypothetical protein